MGSAGGDSMRHQVRVGVFIPTECQLLDAACVDIIGSMSHEYLAPMTKLVPQAVIDVAPSVAIRYIGTVKPGETIGMTSEERIVATNRFDDPEVAPGNLGIVLVPGPNPFSDLSGKHLSWLAEHGSRDDCDILSVCTGIFLCAEAGLIKGRTVCGPRGLQDAIAAKGYGEKALVGHKYRWFQDGNFWSSGGVTNGNDLVAAYCRASRHFPRPVVEIACEMVDVGDRAQEYGKGQSAFIFTLAFNALRAWLMSFSTDHRRRQT